MVSAIAAVAHSNMSSECEFKLAHVLCLSSLCHGLPKQYQFSSERLESRIEALWRTIMLERYQEALHDLGHRGKSLFNAVILTQIGSALGYATTERLVECICNQVAEFCAEFAEEAESGEVPTREEIIRSAKIYSSKARSHEEEQEGLGLARRAQEFSCRRGDVYERSLFRTRQGMLGAGLPLIEPGDEVWFIYGANTPVVLRPEERLGMFKIVGECYLHGCMQGELFKSGELRIENVEPITIV